MGLLFRLRGRVGFLQGGLACHLLVPGLNYNTATCMRLHHVWGCTEDVTQRPCGPPSLKRVVWSFQDFSFVCWPLMEGVLKEE